MMRNDVPLRVKNQTVAAKAARRTIDVTHWMGMWTLLRNLPSSSGRKRSSSTFGIGNKPSLLGRKGRPANRQLQVKPGQMKGSRQNHVPSTETMNEAQITVSNMLVTGGRPAIAIRRAKPHAEKAIAATVTERPAA